MKQTPPSMKETMRLLKSICDRNDYQADIECALHNFTNGEQRECAMYIMEIMQDKGSAVMTALRYGIICGKREERARRRKAVS